MEISREQQDSESVRQLLGQEGWKVLVRKLADRQESLRKAWLAVAEPEQAEKIRQKALGLSEFLRVVGTVLTRGKASKQEDKNPSTPVEQGLTNGNDSNK